jgi:hypothetical protein
MSHVWPTARPGSSIIYEMDSGSTQIASSCIPGTNKCGNAKMSHVWPTVCLGCSVVYGMGSATTHSAFNCMPGMNKYHNA